MADPNALFQAAEQDFSRQNYSAARTKLAQVAQLIDPHPAVLHLRALVEQFSGNDNAALRAFAEARRLAPDDAQIANNHGNLLDALGRFDEAVAAYDAAIRSAPGDVNPRVNLALALQHAGRIDRARERLEAAVALHPGAISALIALAALEMQAGAFDRASELYDRAIAIDPGNRAAAHGRAAVASARGDADAGARYRRLLDAAPGDLALLVETAEVLDASGDEDGRALLAAALVEQPGWADGHIALARMRAEVGEDVASALKDAILVRPGDRALREVLWRTLVHAGRHADALDVVEDTRVALGPDRTLAVEEAAIASEAGQLDRARALLANIPPALDTDLVAGRLALRSGDPERAAALFEAVTAAQPTSINAWAHLGLAWRMLSDPRAHWLNEQSGLWSTTDLPIDETELRQLADVLRGIHKSRVQPLGQSLRSGTQTRGRLLVRAEPEIRSLAAMLEAAVASHLAALPPADPTHPLLRYRDQPFRFAGSWSVRLGGQGFHVPHIHNEGVMSSACYISLPPSDAADPRAGWLELGRPPEELGLPLEPLAVLEPKPGRLALFPSYLHHGTRPFASGERLSVAFDTVFA